MMLYDELDPVEKASLTAGVVDAPSFRRLRLRRGDDPPPPWYERPSLCFITGAKLLPCECCRCHTFGRTPKGSGSSGFLPGTPLCVGCDQMLRTAGAVVKDLILSQRWMHEAYDALPRAVRDYPLEARHA